MCTCTCALHVRVCIYARKEREREGWRKRGGFIRRARNISPWRRIVRSCGGLPQPRESAREKEGARESPTWRDFGAREVPAAIYTGLFLFSLFPIPSNARFSLSFVFALFPFSGLTFPSLPRSLARPSFYLPPPPSPSAAYLFTFLVLSFGRRGSDSGKRKRERERSYWDHEIGIYMYFRNLFGLLVALLDLTLGKTKYFAGEFGGPLIWGA